MLMPSGSMYRVSCIHLPYSGHEGIKTTRKAIERCYTRRRPSLIKVVEHYVLTCPCCQCNKSGLLTRNLVACAAFVYAYQKVG